MNHAIHPVADLFPMLAEDELAELAQSIKERGLDHPIVLDTGGRILDGRNRLAACEIAGVEPRFVNYEGDDTDDYALRNGITRRHLTTGARAIIAAQAARLNGHNLTETAERTDLYRPRLAEATLVLDWRPDLVSAVIAGPEPLSEAVKKARQAKHESEEFKAKMARLRVEAIDLHELVEEGRMTVDEAITVLGSRQANQRSAEHEASIRRAHMIEQGQSAAKVIIPEFQANVSAIVSATREGEERLITKKLISELQRALDLLKAEL